MEARALAVFATSLSVYARGLVVASETLPFYPIAIETKPNHQDQFVLELAEISTTELTSGSRK